MSQSLRVRVAIPHYFRETPGTVGYGSSREGARLTRSLALSRCIHGLLQLERASNDLILNHGQRCVEGTRAMQSASPIANLSLEIHVFTTDEYYLDDVLASHGDNLQHHRVDLDDPRLLALAARDFLVQDPAPLDLALYLEDDLVIHDPWFLDKQYWFLNGCKHQGVLMPHRYELLPRRNGQRLLVDGPLQKDFIDQFGQTHPGTARGAYWDGQEINFDRTSNPHSGLFCLSKEQLTKLQQSNLPNEGFIGPMETAATLTALAFFPIFKPSLEQRGFLWIEHAHPSFLVYVNSTLRDQATT